MKAVNTFFRDTTLTVADVQRMVNQSLDAMVDAIRRFIEDAAVGVEDIRLFTEDLDIDLTRVETPAGRLYVKGNFEHFMPQYIERNRFANMTVLPDPEEDEEEEEPAPAPVKAPVKVAVSPGSMSHKDKRKARQRAKAAALAEAEPAPAPVAPKPVALPTHGWRVKVKTIAPDGPAADAYTRDELMQIKTALGR
jgi:hypothetical protein